jgi:YVTN family beta-propeller protein
VNAELDPRAARAASALHLSAEDIDPYGRLHDLRRLERRRSRAQVVAAFALLVALVAAGLLARRYDPPAVGPLPSLATIAVGRQPTGMAVGRGALWVMNQGSGTISRIDLGAGRVVATVPVGDSPDAIAVGRDAVWVGGWSRDQGDVVRRIDPRTNRVMATVPVASEPYGLAVTDDAVWATSLVAGTVTRIDPRTNRVVATIETGGRPVHVAGDDRSVWVAYPQDTLVRRIDPRTNRVVATLRVAQPQDVAVGFGSVWVASERAREVLRIDPRTDPRTVAGTGRIKVDGEPTFLAVGPDAVWVGTSNQTIQRIDPGTGTVTATYPVGAILHGMAVDGGSLWTVDPVGDTVSRVRLPGREQP